MCERFNVESFPSVRVLEGGKTYDYEGSANASDLFDFIQNKGYKASKLVIDLVGREAADMKQRAEDALASKTLWGRFSGILSRLFSLGKESYATTSAEWVFRTLGLGSLSMTTKMFGFFLVIVAPLFLMLLMLLLLMLLMLLFPELIKINPDKFRAGRVVRRGSPMRSYAEAPPLVNKEKEQ